MKTKEREQAKDEEYLYLTRVANSKSTDVGMMGGASIHIRANAGSINIKP